MQEEDLREVHEFLRGPYRKQLEIVRKENMIAELRSCLLPRAIGYSADRVQSSPDDQMSKMMARIDEMERQVENLKTERSAMLIRVNSMIERLDCDIEKTVLTEWYIRRTHPASIAARIGYSERRMYDYKKDGLRHLGKILKDFSELQ